MPTKYTPKHMIDILFVLILFGLFATSTIILIILGAGTYESTVAHMHSNYNTRTAVSYLTEKFRQADQYDAISIGSIQDVPALTFSENIDGENYVTYIYAYEGKLYELFARKDIEMYPDSGQSVLAVSDFTVEQIKPNLFCFHVSIDENSDYSFYLSSHLAP